jgi:hypothetical protein
MEEIINDSWVLPAGKCKGRPLGALNEWERALVQRSSAIPKSLKGQIKTFLKGKSKLHEVRDEGQNVADKPPDPCKLVPCKKNVEGKIITMTNRWRQAISYVNFHSMMTVKFAIFLFAMILCFPILAKVPAWFVGWVIRFCFNRLSMAAAYFASALGEVVQQAVLDTWTVTLKFLELSPQEQIKAPAIPFYTPHVQPMHVSHTQTPQFAPAIQTAPMNFEIILTLLEKIISLMLTILVGIVVAVLSCLSGTPVA